MVSKKITEKEDKRVETEVALATAKAAPLDDFDISDLPLNTVADYAKYNRYARKLKRPVKVPPSELHRQLKIKFERFDQPENVLKFYIRNAEIDYQGQLIPGKIYTLPAPVVKFLNGLAVPIFAEVKIDDGTNAKTETRQVGEKSRFSCQIVDYMFEDEQEEKTA